MATRRFKPSSSKRAFIRRSPEQLDNLEQINWLHEQRGSSQWKKTRELIKRIQPVCPCGYPGRQVHHIQMAQHHPNLFYELSNLVNLCHRCHADVSSLERCKRFDEAVALYRDQGEQNKRDFLASLLS